MSYQPKIIRGKLHFENITDDEIRKNCSRECEVKAMRKVYDILNGQELLLSLWSYDNYEDYHLNGWFTETDDKMMEVMFILENEFGIYHDYEEFKKIWKSTEDKYEPECSIVFPKKCVKELEVLSEEVKE